jgi:hypothetical protein
MKTKNFEAISSDPVMEQNKRTKGKRRTNATTLSKFAALCKTWREN